MISESTRFPYWCHRCQRETFPVANQNGEPACNFCRQTYIEEMSSFRQDNPHMRSIQQSVPSDDNIRQARRAHSGNRLSYSLIQSDGQGHLIQYTISNPLDVYGNPFNMGNIRNMNASISNNPMLTVLFSGQSPFSNFLQQHTGDQQFESLLNYIMQHDPNVYGTPPASDKSIKELKKEKVNEENKSLFEKQDCSVCKETFKVGDELKSMPCSHSFHEECILPWLKQHNSCPVCRFELPTEDKDYETRKAQLRRTMADRANGGGVDTERRSSSSDDVSGMPHSRRTRSHFHPNSNANNYSNNSNTR